ncbi:MAG TPA: penicillin acylase family protein [Candidatus Polarisedimenticolaceae bacterium]
MKRALRLAAVAAALVATILFLVLLVVARRPLPPSTGTHRLAGLDGPVTIVLDGRNVPHIRATTEADAWRALGWRHAGDRFVQMELRRRAARGTLSELFGPALAGMDGEARAEGYLDDARRSIAAASDEERAALDAYAQGVNAWLETATLPIELALAGAKPAAWTAEDSLAFGALMNAGLTEAPSREGMYLATARAHGLATAAAFAALGEPAPTVIPPIDRFLGRERASIVPESGGARGSNAWAVSGSRTASGKPLLAGDPHLAAEMPGVWYAAHVTSNDGLDVAGLSLPGAPGIFIGRNGSLAWSITMHQADDADLFLSERDGAVAERWRAAWRLRPQGFSCFLDAARAESGAALRAAFAGHTGPSMNVVWADASGSIGVFVAGSIPNRRGGDGRLPVPDGDPSWDWDGLVPFDAMPDVVDPPEGFVASANDDWSAAGRRVPWSGLFYSNDRVLRIRQVLEGTTEATIADFRALQNDHRSRYAERMIGALAGLPLRDPDARRARAILASWDRVADRRGPSLLFYVFMRELRSAAFASRERLGTLPAGWTALDAMVVAGEGAELWDDPTTPVRETREEAVERALARAIARVVAEDGGDPSRWSYGTRHRLLYRHPGSDAAPALAPLLDVGPVELPGDSHTVGVAGLGLGSRTMAVRGIASARLIVDLGDPDASRLVLPLGQSGNLFDRHRDDQLEAWAGGRDFPFPFTRAGVDRVAVSRVSLVP